MLRAGLCLLLMSWALRGLGHDQGAVFTENRGQWPAHVLYQALLPEGGALFVETHGLTYVLRSGGPDHQHRSSAENLRSHVVHVAFEGGSSATGESFAPLDGYANYYIGNDPSQWASRCERSIGVLLRNVYPGIDLRLDGSHGLKLDWLVAQESDPSAIVLRYTGHDQLRIDKAGRLEFTTSTGWALESAPIAFATGTTDTVACHTVLQGDRVRYAFPKGYDATRPLTIDPEMAFGSYSGSTADNFGFTATYGEDGSLYGGGIVFGTGYPVSTGALQPASGGGIIDVGISKWNPTGTTLLWSTYLGGSGNETPHSMVAAADHSLFVMGATGSNNFPTTTGAFDRSFNNGEPILAFSGISSGYGFNFAQGSDIFVSRISPDGTALLASTYVGGSGNDGLNNVQPLAFNYGDTFRGEIILDANGAPVVATTTQSHNAPTGPLAFRSTMSLGTQDAYIFRMDPLLSTLSGTYYGGSSADSGYGLALDEAGHIYVTGGTGSSDLPMAGNPMNPAALGDLDGFVARFDPGLSTLEVSTYIGTEQYDQSFFVQMDTVGFVYLLGQTNGAYPITSGRYGNPNSSRFITKLSPDLDMAVWSTVVGSGVRTEALSPTAFLISECGQIYTSAWGGSPNSLAPAGMLSNTRNQPVTSDAFQSTTDGSDFHLILLEVDATDLVYGTYFGGPRSAEHVDGGTSRFDRHGNVYQAACAGCSNNNDWPTTPGAYSTTNNSRCNLGVFKFRLSRVTAAIHIEGPGYICMPDGTALFESRSEGGDSLAWDFGDGSTSSDVAPTHVYQAPGTYHVRLVLYSFDPCIPNDTAYVELPVIPELVAAIEPVPVLCVGDSVVLRASGGTTYAWSPATGLSTIDGPAPTAVVTSDITYTVIVSDSCSSDTITLPIRVSEPRTTLSAPTTICRGDSVALSATGGIRYAWSPTDPVRNNGQATVIATPDSTTLFAVTVTDSVGCSVADSVLISVEQGLPGLILRDTMICLGGTATLVASGAHGYLWTANAHDGPSLTINPRTDSIFSVLLSNTCGSILDSAFVGVVVPQAALLGDTVICPGDTVTLFASGGERYLWGPPLFLTDPQASSVRIHPEQATRYTVTTWIAPGCMDSATAFVGLHPRPQVYAGADRSIIRGRQTTLVATGNGSILWSGPFIECPDCPSTLAGPVTTTTYAVVLTDDNGCQATDSVTVHINGTLYVPNSFSPDGDGRNETFRPVHAEMRKVEFSVFDRWGLEIFRSPDDGDAWNGSYKGQLAPPDVYVWTLRYEALNGEVGRVQGHVTLLR